MFLPYLVPHSEHHPLPKRSTRPVRPLRANLRRSGERHPTPKDHQKCGQRAGRGCLTGRHQDSVHEGRGCRLDAHLGPLRDEASRSQVDPGTPHKARLRRVLSRLVPRRHQDSLRPQSVQAPRQYRALRDERRWNQPDQDHDGVSPYPPYLLPDGKKIAFSSGGDIYVINAAPESETNPPVNLTADTPGAAQRDPDWQPLP